VVTNNNKTYQSGAVTKVGNAQRVAANQTELQTHGAKLLVRILPNMVELSLAKSLILLTCDIQRAL
jgi:hypothetical protein